MTSTITLQAEGWRGADAYAAGYGFTAHVDTVAQAREYAAQFPKAAGMVVRELRGRLVVVAEGTSLATPGGEKNQAALRRYFLIRRTIAKLGLPTEWVMEREGSFTAPGELEAMI